MNIEMIKDWILMVFGMIGLVIIASGAVYVNVWLDTLTVFLGLFLIVLGVTRIAKRLIIECGIISLLNRYIFIPDCLARLIQRTHCNLRIAMNLVIFRLNKYNEANRETRT
jgi:hypothetical protein